MRGNPRRPGALPHVASRQGRLAFVLLFGARLFAQATPEASDPQQAVQAAVEPAASPDAAPLTVDEIMAKVADNQERSQKERAAYVYKQHIKVVSRHTNGKLAQEEISDYLVTPTEKETKKTVQKTAGRAYVKGSLRDYQKIDIPRSSKDQNPKGVYVTDSWEYRIVDPADKSTEVHLGMVDNSIVDSFRDDLANDKSKDGIGTDLFPLSVEEQKKYTFELLGRETRDGREVYRIRFRPKDKNDIDWAGEAWIDTREFAPVQVATKLSRRIPFGVRAFLGTDVPGLGFSVHYQRVAEGVWFPVSFGTEFHLHAVFVINRDLTMSLENSDFKRAVAESTIRYETPAGSTGNNNGPPTP